MNRVALIILTAIFNLIFINAINAEVKLPAIVSSNMVLQRNTTVKLWGWADAGEKVTIEMSWLKGVLKTKADNMGKWYVEVHTTNSKEPQTINITSKTSDITLTNVMFGEVWLCSGQSNMEFRLEGRFGNYIAGSTMAIVRSNNPNLRLFTVERKASKTPLEDIEDFRSWEQASPKNVSTFSALAYFFGQQLQEILDCPVGLIHASWSGSSIQTWMSKEVLNKYQDVDLTDIDLQKKTNRIPTVIFNGMLNPLVNYGIKGVLWYQGESNHREPKKYKELLPAMVKDWRKRFNQGAWPFYYVQITPYKFSGDEAYGCPENTAFLREAQLQCLELIPNSYMATTLDIGLKDNIHPPYKKEIADRLLFAALNRDYGYEALRYHFPIYDSYEIKDERIQINMKGEVIHSSDEVMGFEIAGEDRVFYPASASINDTGQEILVHSEKVANPVAVRYGWHNYFKATLFGLNGIPAPSFRTDNWDDATQAKK